jgi:hypothetical protein
LRVEALGELVIDRRKLLLTLFVFPYLVPEAVETRDGPEFQTLGVLTFCYLYREK